MTDSPILLDRIRALRDAEAALVAARERRDLDADAAFFAHGSRVLINRPPTDFEIVVDAVVASVQEQLAGSVVLTAEEAALAAWALRHVRGWPDTADGVDYLTRQRALQDRLETVS